MTDLTPDELGRACVLAKLEWDDEGFKAMHGWRAASNYQRSDGVRVTPIYHPLDPALPAYVAELLCAQVVRYMMDHPRADISTGPGFWASSSNRIRAALEVLG